MKLDKDFLELIENNGTLTQKQFEILEIQKQDEKNWKNIALQKDVTKNNKNLLMLLKNIENPEFAQQLVLNYLMVLNYNNINAKVYTPKNINNNEIEEDKEFLHIYCDGACSGNPGFAGSGLAIYSNKKNPVLLYGAFVENGTNNIAELNALYQALLIAKQSGFKDTIYIYSDSKYSIDCISTWAFSWKKNGWTKKGGEIKNLDLIIKSHELYLSLKSNLVLEYVKGHSGVEGNELADRMALTAIKEKNEEFNFYRYEKVEEVLKIKSS
ncbi:ribonuclease H family protein [Arcobacter vandammei]|uniref:ribonuclease H family protein n=1 Tax=Arcobacter vandammei TaxID=2782243 RepID=UPI0018DF190C|nr:ribonuclease H family protein [Arcobacter vandammei]